MTLKTVLVAVGPKDSDRVDELAEAAIEVAGPAGAKVVLAHVFTPTQLEEAAERLDFDTADAVDPTAVAHRHATIRNLMDALDAAAVEFDVYGRKGDHATEIVDLSEEIEADRIIVGGRKRSPSGKAVFGSVAQDIMLEAPCPVTFVKART
ncbi:MAG: universal stress protein [archaeon]